MSPSPILDAEGARTLVKSAVRDAFAAHDKPVPVPMVNLSRQRKPNLWRAFRAAADNWRGAELERDLSQATGELGHYSSSSDPKGTLYVPTSPAEYLAACRACDVETPATKALGEYTTYGTWTIGTGGGGALAPLQYLGSEFAIPLAPATLIAMPEVHKIPVVSEILEFPRTAIAPAQVPSEAGAITASDLVPALGELRLSKVAVLQWVSNSLMQDAGPDGAAVMLQDALRASIEWTQDYELLEGPGTTTHLLGLANLPGLTTSSWTAATNGSTPGGDDLANMVFDIYTAKARPTAMLAHPRTWNKVATLKNAQGGYMFPDLFDRGQVADPTVPARIGSLFGVSCWSVPSLSITDTQGSSSAATRIIYGDYSKVWVLQRGLQFFVSSDYAMNVDSTVIRVTSRSAVALSQPTAVAVASGII